MIPTLELRPLDPDIRIIPRHAALIIRMPEVIHLIAEFCYIRQYQKTVGEAFRDEELLLIFFCQLGAIPFP